MDLIRPDQPRVRALRQADGKLQIYVDQYRLFGVANAQIGFDQTGTQFLTVNFPFANIEIGEAPPPPVLTLAGPVNPDTPWAPQDAAPGPSDDAA